LPFVEQPGINQVIPQFKTANFEKKRGLCFRPTKCMELLSMVDIAMDRNILQKQSNSWQRVLQENGRISFKHRKST